MKILLVNSNQIQPPVEPLGLTYIARATMDAGHDVNILDLNFSTDIGVDIPEAVRNFSPEAIGITIRNIDNVTMLHSVYYIPEVKNIIDMFKKHSNVPIVLGGPGFSIMPEDIMKELDVPYGVIGEGEIAFAELLQCISKGEKPVGVDGVVYRDGDAFIRNKRKNMSSEELDALPFPARELIDNIRYLNDGGMGNIQTRRGCDKQCPYCTYPVIEGRVMRYRSPEKIVDEIVALKEEGIDYLHFTDSAMNIPEHHALAILNEMLKRNVTIKYSPYIYPAPPPSRKLIRLAKKTGCDGVVLGVDALSEKMLLNLRKGFTVRDVEQYVTFCREFDLPFILNLLFGGSGETRETVIETLDNLDRLESATVGAIIGIRCYPHTHLWKTACDEGLITKNQSILEPYYYVSRTIDRDWLVATIRKYYDDNDNFLMSTSNKGGATDDAMIQIFRDGFRGPYWELAKELKKKSKAKN